MFPNMRTIRLATIVVAVLSSTLFLPLAAQTTECSYAVIVEADFHPVAAAIALDDTERTICVNQGGSAAHIMHLCLCFDIVGWTLIPEQPYFYADAGCEFADAQGEPPADPPEPAPYEEWCHRTLLNPCM